MARRYSLYLCDLDRLKRGLDERLCLWDEAEAASLVDLLDRYSEIRHMVSKMGLMLVAWPLARY